MTIERIETALQTAGFEPDQYDEELYLRVEDDGADGTLAAIRQIVEPLGGTAEFTGAANGNTWDVVVSLE